MKTRMVRTIKASAVRMMGVSLMAALLLFLTCLSMAGATTTVMSLDDPEIGDNPPTDPTTLRYQIYYAQAGDQITFAVSGTIHLNPLNGWLDIEKDLTICGPGAGSVTIDGGHGTIFEILGSNHSTVTNVLGPTVTHILNPTVTICNLTLQNGYVGYGGAILVSDASLNLTGCLLQHNFAQVGGGALAFSGIGNSYISGCTFFGNSAGEGEIYPGVGGAILSDPPMSLSIHNSTFSGNSARSAGGAIADGFPGTIGLNCSENLSIVDCTIVSNTVSADEIGIIGGGAIYSRSGTFLQNTIVAENSLAFNTTGQGGQDLEGNFTSGDFNFIGTQDDATPCTGWKAHDLLGSTFPFNPLDPGLGPLGNNGGPVPTHLPKISPLSPVIDQGNSTAAFDQRGWPRPYNWTAGPYPGNTNDIGAVEIQPLPRIAGFGPPQLGSLAWPPHYSLILGPPPDPILVNPNDPADSYQWQFNGTNIPGANFSIYSFTNLSLANAGLYSLVLSNSAGISTDLVANVAVGNSLSVASTSNSATILRSSDQRVYAPSSLVTVTAIPQYGWVFDNWSGDALGSSNTITLVMTTNLSIVANLHYTNPPPGSQITACSPGEALGFNGSSSYVQIPGFLSNSPVNEVTVEFWQKVSTAKVQSTFSESSFVNGSVFNAHVPYSDGNVYWDFGNISTGGRLVWTPPAPITGTWWHFALVASQMGNYMRIYTNGNLAAEKTGMTTFTRANLDLDIGGAANLGVSFGGQIDEFRIWNYARSQSQIQANMNHSIAAPQPGLVAYWRMDEGAGSTTMDSSGAGNTGALVGGPVWAVSTIPFVPCVVTGPSIAVSGTNAVLTGSVDPNGSGTTTNWFEFTPANNYFLASSPQTTIVASDVTNAISQLWPGNLYHYRLAAMNSAGISYGSDMTFETPVSLRTFKAPANSVGVAWPAVASGFSLQQNNSLNSPNWLFVGSVTTLVGSENQVSVSPPTGTMFYRLCKPQ